MTAHVLVEGNADRLLVDRALAASGVRGVTVHAAQGQSAAISSARTLLAMNEVPVAVLVDADTYEPRRIREREQSYEFLLGMTGQPESFRILLAVPEVEAVLFGDTDILEKVSGVALSDEEKIEARYRPRQILSDLLRRSPRMTSTEQLIGSLSDSDLQRLSGHPLIASLVSFLKSAKAS